MFEQRPLCCAWQCAKQHHGRDWATPNTRPVLEQPHRSAGGVCAACALLLVCRGAGAQAPLRRKCLPHGPALLRVPEKKHPVRALQKLITGSMGSIERPPVGGGWPGALSLWCSPRMARRPHGARCSSWCGLLRLLQGSQPLWWPRTGWYLVGMPVGGCHVCCGSAWPQAARLPRT